LSRAGTAAEQVKPANDGYRHANHSKERTLASDERRIHEDRLHRAWPNNEQGTKCKINKSVHHRVFRCSGQASGFLKKIAEKRHIVASWVIVLVRGRSKPGKRNRRRVKVPPRIARRGRGAGEKEGPLRAHVTVRKGSMASSSGRFPQLDRTGHSRSSPVCRGARKQTLAGMSADGNRHRQESAMSRRSLLLSTPLQSSCSSPGSPIACAVSHNSVNRIFISPLSGSTATSRSTAVTTPSRM
jgi:hypothetical protein